MIRFNPFKYAQITGFNGSAEASSFFKRCLSRTLWAGCRRSVVILLAFLLMAVCCLGAALQADLTELSLEELMEIRIDTVYGASRYVQKVTEAPSSVTIVTADEIREYGYRTDPGSGEHLQDVIEQDGRSFRLQLTYGF